MQVGFDLVPSANCKSQLQFQLTNNYQLLYITSTIYFNQQRLSADGILIPNLHKALLVGRNAMGDSANTKRHDLTTDTTNFYSTC